MTQSEKKIEQSAQRDQLHYIGDYKQAPDYMKDNEHITHGYRIGFNTPRKILQSLFMVHNELVNIWTHFFPAIIIVCLLFYLVFTISQNEMILKFEEGRHALYSGIDSYSNALGQYASTFNMSKIKQMTNHEISQLQQSLINSYEQFTEGTQIWKKNAQQSIHTYGESMKSSMWKNIHKMQKIKNQFQNVFVPHFLNQILRKIDSEKLLKLKSKLHQIQNSIDSEKYEYIQLLHKHNQGDSQITRWPLFVFLGSAIICLMCSTLFHLFYPMSGKAYQVFCRLDYAGINVLISGSSFPVLYYGMYCNSGLAMFYLIFIVSIGSTLFVVTLFQFLHRPQNLVLKSVAYGGFGISLAIPMTHAFINQVLFNNYGDTFSMMTSLDDYICCGIAYLFGLYVYTIRCPERHRPGNYNICGHSHQIWHCFVVLGIIFTYMGALQNLEARRHASCPLTPHPLSNT